MRSKWWIAVVVTGVVGLHGYGQWQRWRPLSGEEALLRLIDGDVDRGERLRCLRAVRDAGSDGGAPRLQVAAAMAALALGDEAAWAALSAVGGAGASLLSGNGPQPPADIVQDLHTLSLGETALRHLLRGHLQAAAGDTASARAELRAAEDSATWLGDQLIVTVARRSLQRLER